MIHESKPHPFIAGVADFYFMFYALGAIIGILNSLFKVITPPLFLLVFYPLFIIIVILYYKIWSKKTLWLSPGELFAGRTTVRNKKEWINPYRINRFLLYFALFITMFFWGNSWDVLSRGEIISTNKCIFTIITLVLAAAGSVQIGMRKIVGIIFILIPLLYNFVLSFFLDSVAQEIPQGSTISIEEFALFGRYFYGSIILLNVIMFAFYYFVSRKGTKKQ